MAPQQNRPTPYQKNTGADEKHGTISGEKVYIATTVAEQCFWGASVSVGAGEEDLTAAYGQFQREAQQVQPDYHPETVNTDGWQATMNAWRTLLPSMCLIQCFLYAILGIRNVATKAQRPSMTRLSNRHGMPITRRQNVSFRSEYDDFENGETP